MILHVQEMSHNCDLQLWTTKLVEQFTSVPSTDQRAFEECQTNLESRTEKYETCRPNKS